MTTYLALLLIAYAPPADHLGPDRFRSDAETRFVFPSQRMPPPMPAPTVRAEPRHIPLTNRELFPEQFGPQARRESDVGSWWPFLTSLGVVVGYVAGFVIGRWARAEAEGH